MRSRTTTHSRNRSLSRLWVLAAAVAASGLLLGGSPARAGDFKDGFQDQLGRIAAFQVVNAGRFLLTARLHPYGPPHDHYRPPAARDWRHDRRHHRRHDWRDEWSHRRFHRRHQSHHRHANGRWVVGHYHAADDPCGYELTSYSRNGGASDRYVTERYERRR